MPRVSQDAFLNELTKLLEKSKEKKSGSVQLSFKRCKWRLVGTWVVLALPGIG